MYENEKNNHKNNHKNNDKINNKNENFEKKVNDNTNNFQNYENINKNIDNNSKIWADNVDSSGKIKKSKSIKPGYCEFPFKHKKEIHDKCIKGSKGDWCATSVNEKLKMLTWGYCKKTKK